MEPHFPITKRIVRLLKKGVKNTHLAVLFDMPLPGSSGKSRSPTISPPKTAVRVDIIPTQPGSEDLEVTAWKGSPVTDVPISHLFIDANHDNQSMMQYEFVEQPWFCEETTEFTASDLSWPEMQFKSSFRPSDVPF